MQQEVDYTINCINGRHPEFISGSSVLIKDAETSSAGRGAELSTLIKRA